MSEEIRLSEFNELQFKMIRIHKLQDQINELWINALAPNLSFGDYNFNLIIRNLESLYSEVHAKCGDEEREKADKMFEELDDKIIDAPPFESKNHPTSRKASLSEENWKAIKKGIREINFYIRELLDNHGYSPDKDDDTRGL